VVGSGGFWGASCLVSAAVHTVVAAWWVIVAAPRLALIAGPRTAPADAHEDRLVTVELVDDEPNPSADQVEPIGPVTPMLASRRAPLPRRRPYRRTLAILEPARGTEVAPPPGHPGHPIVAPEDDTDPELDLAPDTVEIAAGPRGQGAGTAAHPHEPASPPEESPVIPTGEASYLRTHETYPGLPASLRRRDRTYVVLVRVCVASDGGVDRVLVEQGAAWELDQVIVSAIRTWRYRPRVVGGIPAPFCHRLKLEYTMQ